MNYKRIYDSIIVARQTISFAGYTETHHIIPRCLGGSDDKSNLVELSAKEHFLCHLLLTKIYSSGPVHYKMLNAFLMMLVKGNGQQRFITSRSYQHIREKYSLFLSDYYKGTGNSQFGTKWISNPTTKISKKIKSTDDIPDGFYLGRNLRWKTCVDCKNKHFLVGALCRVCKNKFKNRTKKEKIVLKKPLKPKLQKICSVCSKSFLTHDRTFCSLACSKINGNAAVARKVQDDLGNIFNTLTEASKYYNITVEAIRYRIKIKRYKYL